MHDSSHAECMILYIHPAATISGPTTNPGPTANSRLITTISGPVYTVATFIGLLVAIGTITLAAVTVIVILATCLVITMKDLRKTRYTFILSIEYYNYAFVCMCMGVYM